MNTAPDDIVLTVRNLSVNYETAGDPVRAVRNVDLELRRGQIYGIAGESGCGKSTLLYALSRLLKAPARIVGGEVTFSAAGQDVDVLALDDEDLRRFRWARLSLVFQSALNALNPVLTIHSQLRDVLLQHKPELGRDGARTRALELLKVVGVPGDRLESYPHQLSGGMRQRVMIALALALDPDVILMDEPTTALDVVTQRQILDEILRLRQDRGFAVIFITHDISLLLEIADVISVMYAGRIVETGLPENLLADPKHPYTRGLLESFPPLDGPKTRLTGIGGTPPDLKLNVPGCSFHPRCPMAMPECTTSRPELLPVFDRGHADESEGEVACFLYQPAVVDTKDEVFS